MQFTPYRSWQEFCSAEHRNSFYEKFSRHPFAQVLTDEDLNGKAINSGGEKNGKPEKSR